MSENKDFVIKVNGVSKDYGKAHVLDNMTFSVPKGSIFGLVGRNGAGKTTASYSLLPEMLDCKEFVNSDEFAKGLSPFDPSKASIHAGVILH